VKKLTIENCNSPERGRTWLANRLLDSLPRPVFDAKAWHLSEVSEIATEQCGIGGDGDTGDAQVERTEAATGRTERMESGVVSRGDPCRGRLALSESSFARPFGSPVRGA
jgi:hypothetical protein